LILVIEIQARNKEFTVIVLLHLPIIGTIAGLIERKIELLYTTLKFYCIENSTYNILIALGKEGQFLYSTVDRCIEDARKDNRPHLVDMWNEMKRDKEKHLKMLREALEREAKEEKLR
jgi:hypothetical protein